MRETLYQPSCYGCSHDVHYQDAVPMRTCGVMMHCGERYCTGGKRARRFKHGDPQSHVPKWCPKRKNPCELRIYALKSLEDWSLHDLLSEGLGELLSPAASRYALRFDGTIELTPQEFGNAVLRNLPPICFRSLYSSMRCWRSMTAWDLPFSIRAGLISALFPISMPKERGRTLWKIAAAPPVSEGERKNEHGK